MLLKLLLIIVCVFLITGILSGVLTGVGFNNDSAVSLARILIAGILLVIFSKDVDFSRSFSGLPLGLPALVFVIWNCIYNPLSGMRFAGFDALPSAVLNGLAPGIFEEVLFRGITIGEMEKAGVSKKAQLLVPAIVFGGIHLTNMIAGDIASTLVQTLYATVIGLLFGAVYIRSDDLVSVILYHALIDISSRMFTGTAGPASMTALFLLMIILLAVTVYAVRISGVFKTDQE